MFGGVPEEEPELVPAPFGSNRYAPAILTRQGERLAMRELPEPVKAAITPLFVVHPIDLQPGTTEPVRSVSAHLEKLARQLRQDWGSSPAFVDLRFIDTSKPLEDGRHPLLSFVVRCRESDLPLAPVISGAQAPSYRRAAVEGASAAGTTIALRLSPDEWANTGTPLGDGHLQGLLAETGREPEAVHLILDVEEIGTSSALVAAAVRPALRSLPHANQWASLTVLGTGMPVGTQEVGRDSEMHLPRREWALWRALDGADHRRSSFGDYVVQNPDPISNFDPRFMDSSAQLRYTTSNSWFVVRGRGMKADDGGAEQIRTLAEKIVSDPIVYSGRDFSWGDRWLWDCVHNAGAPGGQGVWRKVTTNHHLTFVVGQLASPHGS